MNDNKMNDQQLRELAKERLEAKNDFKQHLTAFIAVNIALVAVYLITSPGGYPWFLWVWFGWGIGLIMHYAQVKTITRRNSINALEDELRQMREESTKK